MSLLHILSKPHPIVVGSQIEVLCFHFADDGFLHVLLCDSAFAEHPEGV
jgi:hypothetical protein